MQSISIKSNLPILIDLSIDKWILIFTDWLLWVISKNESKYLCDIKIWINDHLLFLPCQMEKKCFLQENMLYLISRFSLTSNQKSLVFRGTEALSDIVNVFVPAQKLSSIVRVLTNFSFIRLTDHFLLFFLAFKSTLVVLNKHVTFFGIGSFFIQKE